MKTIEKLRELLAKATPGPWEVDTERNEDAEYGSGPDCGRGFDDFVIGAPAGIDRKWETILCTDNATLKEIDEDYDEDYHRAWDRIGEANTALIVAAVNALPTLLDKLERLQKGLAKIAEMTDVEADFADGFELRAIARTALQGAADV